MSKKLNQENINMTVIQRLVSKIYMTQYDYKKILDVLHLLKTLVLI